MTRRLIVLTIALSGTPLQAQQWTIASAPQLTLADDLGQIVTATTLGTGTIVVADASNKRLVHYIGTQWPSSQIALSAFHCGVNV